MVLPNSRHRQCNQSTPMTNHLCLWLYQCYYCVLRKNTPELSGCAESQDELACLWRSLQLALMCQLHCAIFEPRGFPLVSHLAMAWHGAADYLTFPKQNKRESLCLSVFKCVIQVCFDLGCVTVGCATLSVNCR